MDEELIIRMMEYYQGDPKRVQHFMKVYLFAKLIGEKENLSEEQLHILCTAAIVHDIGIRKAEELYGRCDGKLQEQLGPDLAEEMLIEIGYKEKCIEEVRYLVGHHHTYTNIDSINYQILVEADFLVNIYEDACAPDAIKNIYMKIFKTETGKKLMRNLYFG